MIIWWQDDNDGDKYNDDIDNDDFLLQSRLQMSLSLDAGNSHLPHQGIFKGRESQIGFILSQVLFVKMGHWDLKTGPNLPILYLEILTPIHSKSEKSLQILFSSLKNSAEKVCKSWGKILWQKCVNE